MPRTTKRKPTPPDERLKIAIATDRDLTAGQVARIFKVAPATVHKWCRIDLPHWHIPHSEDRRISLRALIRWAQKHGLNPPILTRILWGGQPSRLSRHVAELLEPTAVEHATCPVKAGEIMGGHVIAAAVFVLDEWVDVYARDVIAALRERRANVPVIVVARDDGADEWYEGHGVKVLGKGASAADVSIALGAADYCAATKAK